MIDMSTMECVFCTRRKLRGLTEDVIPPGSGVVVVMLFAVNFVIFSLRATILLNLNLNLNLLQK